MLALLVIAGLVCAPFSVCASVAVDGSVVKVLPGNPRAVSPQYSLAWLDNVIIRDNANAVTSARLVPKADYPYSHTFSEFINEVNNYSVLNLINEETVASAYTEVINVLYYMVTALGMTSDSETMKAYVRSCGITIPALETAEDEIKVAVVYAALKYDAVYTLYNKKVTFPQGITLDSAICLILAELTGTFLPSGVDTVSGFAVNGVKTYVTEFEDLPVSNNPSNSEIFHWAKVITAASNDYDVPLTAYDVATEAQKEYVDYAYFATILNTAYGVRLDPVRLVVADRSEEDNGVAKLILQTMLDEDGTDYSIDDSCESLFNAACKNGRFNLDEEFYSDIFNYDLYIANDCQRVWFTPFALADQLGGDNEKLVMTLGTQSVKPNQTVYYAADPNKTNDSVELKVSYGETDETVTYKFNIIRSSASQTSASTAQNSAVAEIDKMISGIIPSGNEKANAVVDSVIGNVDAVLSSTVSSNENVLTTYGIDSTSSSGYNSSPIKGSDGIDFGYLEQLMSETYADSEQASKAVSLYSSMTGTTESRSFVQKTVDTIKENPEIAAAPTSIIALGGLGGYIWTRRKKNALSAENSQDTTFAEDDD